MLSTILVIITLLVVGALVYLATLPGSYEIRRSRVVNADPQTAFDKVRDFNTWVDWSPWLIHEPTCKLEYSDNSNDVDGWYTWDGQFIGAGKMMHEKFDAPRRMDQKLEFYRPFKSKADIAFEFEEKDGGTAVTWVMHGEMPFMFRFMIPNIIKLISKDYDFGLARLAGLMDANSEHPVIGFEEDKEFPAKHVICRPFEGHLDDMVGVLKETYPALMQHAMDKNLEITGPPFTAYHKADLKKMVFAIDMSLPVAEGSDAGEYDSKTLGGGGKYFKTTLKGSYDFMEIAWHEAMGHMQMCKLKEDKSRSSFEVYENDPNTVAHSNELMTSLYIPVK